jgi:hypothetical protein
VPSNAPLKTSQFYRLPTLRLNPLGSRTKFFFQNSNPPLVLASLRNLRPFFSLLVLSSLDRTPTDKWHDPLTTRCLVRCSLQSLQGERERRIGERTWVVLAQIKIVFKNIQNFQKNIFPERKRICAGK